MKENNNGQLHMVAKRLKQKIPLVPIKPTNAAFINEVITLVDLILESKDKDNI